jgi:ABC-type branched-subunit amino acid transport system permease subunit/ABC-type branched-subunit amino acid transport system ATPase component
LLGASNYLLHICALVFVYVSLGLGLNIVVGLAGLLDLGYVGFYAVGAYGYALMTTRLGMSFLPAALLSVISAAMIGVILGWPTIRTRGDYLALVTLGFGEMIRLLARNWVELTNGPQGLMNVCPPSFGSIRLETPLHYYYLGLLLGVAVFTLFSRVKLSSVGQLLTAIRDDEDSAAAVGVNPVRWKLYAFAVGAGVAGLAGVFFASWQRFVSPESFTLGESILVLCIVVLGGVGRAAPTVCAATFLVVLPEGLRGLGNYRALILGLMLVLVVIVQERVAARRRRRPIASEAQAGDGGQTETGVEAHHRPARNQPAGLLLRVEGVSKSFGGVCALQNVTLDFQCGEVVGIVGANGAGKTTMFNCIAGAIPTKRGKILLAQQGRLRRVRNGLLPQDRAQLGIVRTFQQPRLFSSLNALENVEIGSRCHTVPRFWDPILHKGGRNIRKVSELSSRLREVGAPEGTKPVAEMSFIEQKLTELARALAAEPLLLLLDEPAAGLSPHGRERLAKVLNSARREVTIVVIEHDLLFLRRICDRLVVMKEGSIVAEGALGDARVTEAIRESYSASYEPRTA